jgi:hypothetical protein
MITNTKTNNIIKLDRMKIYVFDWGGATEWVAAKSLKQAKECYEYETGNSDTDDCDISLMPREKWGDALLCDHEEREPIGEEYDKNNYHKGYKIIMTFEEYMNECVGNEPEIIASTEY